MEKQAVGGLKRVAGKISLLFEIASTRIAEPNGTAGNVVFPVAGEQSLRDLARA